MDGRAPMLPRVGVIVPQSTTPSRRPLLGDEAPSCRRPFLPILKSRRELYFRGRVLLAATTPPGGLGDQAIPQFLGRYGGEAMTYMIGFAVDHSINQAWCRLRLNETTHVPTPDAGME